MHVVGKQLLRFGPRALAHQPLVSFNHTFVRYNFSPTKLFNFSSTKLSKIFGKKHFIALRKSLEKIFLGNLLNVFLNGFLSITKRAILFAVPFFLGYGRDCVRSIMRRHPLA